MELRAFDLTELLGVPNVDAEHGFDISPDGMTLAFSWNKSGQWEIYLAPVDRSIPAKVISTGAGAKFAPKFSPDGGKLVYTVDLDGSETLDIVLFDLVDKNHSNLTADTSFSIQPSLSWSPDSKQVAFLADRDGIFDIYLLAIDGSGYHKVFGCGAPFEAVAWSPDGSCLAAWGLSSAQEFATYIIPLDGRAPYVVSAGGSPLNARDPDWAPDGSQLVLCVEKNDLFQIAVFNLQDGSVRWLTKADCDHSAPVWSPDGNLIAAVRYQGPDTWLEIIDLRDNSIRSFQASPGVHYAPLFSLDSRTIFVPFDNYAHPTDLWQLSLESGDFWQFNDSLGRKFNPAEFIVPEHIWYPALDGASVPALLFKPRQAAKSPPPAVIVIHGGPTWLFQYLWYPIFQHYASRGWVVLAPNYRGSTGYGVAWQTANRFDIGGIDTRDVVAGAQYLIQTGLADPKRIALTGRSHGGYLTMTCLVGYPEYFAGGSAIVPFLNWFSSHEKIREDLKHWDIENMGDPVENHDRWYQASPYFFLERLESPVQLICGANDPRCPASDSIEAANRLKELGKSYDFVLYPDEGHGFLKIENVIDHEIRRVNFLAGLLA